MLTEEQTDQIGPDTEPDVKTQLLAIACTIDNIAKEIPTWFLRYHTVKISKSISSHGQGVTFMVWGFE